MHVCVRALILSNCISFHFATILPRAAERERAMPRSRVRSAVLVCAALLVAIFFTLWPFSEGHNDGRAVLLRGRGPRRVYMGVRGFTLSPIS